MGKNPDTTPLLSSETVQFAEEPTLPPWIYIGFSTGATYLCAPGSQESRVGIIECTATPRCIPLEINLWNWQEVQRLSQNIALLTRINEHIKRGGQLILHAPPPPKKTNDPHEQPVFDMSKPETLANFKSLKDLAKKLDAKYVVFHPYWFSDPSDLLKLWGESMSEKTSKESKAQQPFRVTPAIEIADMRNPNWIKADDMKKFVELGARLHIDIGHILSLTHLELSTEQILTIFFELCELDPIGFHLSDVDNEGNHVPLSETDESRLELIYLLLSDIGERFSDRPITMESPVSNRKLTSCGFGRNGSEKATRGSNLSYEYWLIVAGILSAR